MSPPMTMTSQELRKLLEAVWNSGKIACPNNLVRWSLKQPDWPQQQGWQYIDLPIWYNKGQAIGKKRIKLKGYSHLSKNYQLEWRWAYKDRQKIARKISRPV